MKLRCAFLCWIVTLPLMAQTPPFNLPGTLRLIDKPPESTPVEALSFRVHPLSGGYDISAQPDRDGKFVLRNVQPGRYSLTFPMPGRIASFVIGTEELNPFDFELPANEHGPLSIVVSMKSATATVRVIGLESGQSDALALLVPFDSRLTLQTSCYSSQLTGPNTTFRFVPAGRYRVLVFNHKYSQDVSLYAPRDPGFLSGESVTIDASPDADAEVSVSYIPNDKVEAAINAAGGPFKPFADPHRATP